MDDKRTEATAADIGRIVAALSGEATDVAALAARLTVATATRGLDTGRTTTGPERAAPDQVTSAERRAQYGVGTDADNYELLDGAPVGTPEDWEAYQREQRATLQAASQARQAAAMATRAASWTDDGAPTRAAKRAARAAAHRARKCP